MSNQPNMNQKNNQAQQVYNRDTSHPMYVV